MLQMNDVVKTFDDTRALDGLDLHVPDGCVYGLVGPNGAGKTTAINHLCGVLKQDSGTVTFDGQTIFDNPVVKARIATIPSDIYYYTQASARDLAKIYAGNYSTFSMEKFDKLQPVFDIDPKRLIRTLSKGMKKQVAFWISLSMLPDVLLLDEPVDGLDPVMRRQVWGLVLAEVAERGMTVLASSHNLRELEDVCDSVGIMDKGKMLIERSLSELQDNIVKAQVAFAEEIAIPDGLNILHRTDIGHISTLIVRNAQSEVQAAFASLNPLFIDILPLTLEEIFVYELGGVGYEVKDIVL
ncbi:MAG: ABC transporter ATP-binding protein [bacterium]|nr:ABC transporter ATP-binding protein [bacterium]